MYNNASLPLFSQVRAVENKVDFPTRHDWDSFFRDAKDMNETLPGERPDTIHLEGLPCRWFSQKDSQYPDRPSEEVLIAVFQTFGKVVHVSVSAFHNSHYVIYYESLLCRAVIPFKLVDSACIDFCNEWKLFKFVSLKRSNSEI